MSQCKALKAIETGRKVHTYTNGEAQLHWGLSSRDRWSIYDVKKDPLCQVDLANFKKDLVNRLDEKYDEWWSKTYPIMITKGGDKGNPTFKIKVK